MLSNTLGYGGPILWFPLDGRAVIRRNERWSLIDSGKTARVSVHWGKP